MKADLGWNDIESAGEPIGGGYEFYSAATG